MDIPKKDVTMEDVETARALRKARSGIEEEETGLFVSLLCFLCTTPNRYPRNSSNTIISFCRISRKFMCFCA
jgi:hypothetical protein